MPHYKNTGNVTNVTNFNNIQTFDSPDVGYDEFCLFYNGSFDLKCLATNTLVPKRGGSKPARVKSYPQVDVINLVFKTCVEYVNDKQYGDEEYCEIKRYQYTKDQSNVAVRTVGMDVRRRLLRITSDEFNVNTISRFLDTDNNPTSVVSSSMTKLKTYVSSSLHFNKPQKIKINSGIIKVNESSYNKPKK